MAMKQNTSELVKLGLFTALIVLLTVTPLGYISLGVINATTIQMPVIIGAILLGWKKGAFLGGVFGLTSLIKNTLQPGISSFVFSPFIPVIGEEKGSFLAVLVCFLPRILIGVTAGLLFNALAKTKLSKTLSAAICGFCGSLTNTVFVMAGIYFCFGESYSAAKEIAYESLLGTVMATITGVGITEAFVSAVISAAVCTALFKALKSKG